MSVNDLRNKLAPEDHEHPHIKTRPDLYDFLGDTLEEQARTIGKRLLEVGTYATEAHRSERQPIFEYIVRFLHNSTFEAEINAPIGKGLNLAKHPYLAPTGLVRIENGKNSGVHSAIEITEPLDSGVFRFQEQYRWDTYFQNKFLLLIGADEIAINQLLNLVEVFESYERIPNALTTDFLSHPQPPFEAIAAFEILEARSDFGKDNTNLTHVGWFDRVMRVAQEELFTEWWDYGRQRIHPRQDPRFHENQEVKGREIEAPFYNPEERPFLTRYVTVHFHSLLVGVQDGKDHQRLTAQYGEEYLAVQLHTLLWGLLDRLVDYYTHLNPDADRCQLYQDAQEKLGKTINDLMWNPDAPADGAWRNYSLRDGTFIEYGDLSAEIFPLFVGLATRKQAEKTLENLKRYYTGDIGLASTSIYLRYGGPLAGTVSGWPESSTQWELNTWPPLMLVAVEGLMRDEYADIPGIQTYATELMQRWVAWLEHSFFDEHSLLYQTIPEKCQFDTRVLLSEGFYGNLPGFGWSIACYGTFLSRLSRIENGLEGIDKYKQYFDSIAIRHDLPDPEMGTDERMRS